MRHEKSSIISAQKLYKKSRYAVEQKIREVTLFKGCVFIYDYKATK